MIIYLAFKPLSIEKKSFTDVPLFEVNSFDIYELSTEGLKTILSGSNSKRYSDRYTIKDMDYTDNSKKYIVNMQSDKGIYRDTVVDLIGHVHYVREDGLTFKSDDAHYNKKSSVVSTEHPYIAYRGKNVVEGTSLKYNNVKNQIESKNIKVIYQLDERVK